MAGQETLIYIEENDQKNAGISAKKFTKEDVQNRAYYNTLGANLVKKYLASENIDVSETYNIHSIQKILEELDISDIMLKNIHIDVRIIFNENYIFIPKSHFDYDILPDIYVVLLMSNDKKYTKLLGFFEPKLINKNNQNEEYYFIEKEKLSPAENLKTFISNFNGNTTQKLSDSDTDESSMLFLSLIDHDIEESRKKQLLKNLTKSAALRDRLIEFENFELLAYNAENSEEVNKAEFLEMSDITFDAAATATAAALQEFTTAKANEQIAKQNDIENSFTNLERSIPDFTPENADLTIDEYESEFLNMSVEPLQVEPELKETPATEDVHIKETSNLLSDEPVDFDSLEKVVDDTNIQLNQNIDLDSDSNTINFEEFQALSPTKNNTKESLPQETMDLNDITISPQEKHEPVVSETNTIDFDTLEPVRNSSNKQSAATEPDTLDFDDIKTDISEELTISNLAEPELELESLDDLALDSTDELPSDNQKAQTETKFETAKLEELEESSDILLNENMPEELSLDENMTIDNDLIETKTSENVENIDFDNIKQALKEDTDDNANEKFSTNTEETVNLEELTPLSIEASDEITEEDKELDAMLATENLTSDTTENQQEQQPITTDIEKQTPQENDSSEIVSLEDLKELGLEVDDSNSPAEETQEDVNTGDLISEIDDLLGSQNNDSEQKIQESNEDNTDNTQNKLEMLFNLGDTQNTEDEDSEEYEDNTYINQDKVSAPEKGKKAIIVAAALVTVLAAVAGTGLFLKNKNGSDADVLAQNPIGNDPINTPTPEAVQEPIANNNDLMSNTPIQEPQAPKSAPKAQKPAPAPANTTAKPAPAANKAGVPTPYISVRSLTWEVPDYLSYSDKVKKYLQTAGKSIRLTLSSDLLLATEYAYSNQVRVEAKLKNDGTVEDIKITKSSGSNQINEIVLRTVKDTLNVVKPAPGEIPNNNFKLGLIINF